MRPAIPWAGSGAAHAKRGGCAPLRLLAARPMMIGSLLIRAATLGVLLAIASGQASAPQLVDSGFLGEPLPGTAPLDGSERLGVLSNGGDDGVARRPGRWAYFGGMPVVDARSRTERLARATARVVRPGTAAAAALTQTDDAWWEGLSVADRVRLAFRLSVEQWRLHGWREDPLAKDFRDL